MFPAIVGRLRALVRRQAIERRLDEEIRLHLDLETEKNVRLGLAPADARRQALLDFGGIEAKKEEHRDMRGIRPLDDLMADLRHGQRVLRRNAVFTLSVVFTLALGIAANTAIFSVVNAVILRPLPFPRGDRLVMLAENNPDKGWKRETAAPANYLDWKERVTAFADVAAYTPGGGSTLTGFGAARQLRIRNVTGNYFSVLGVQPEVGRTLTEAETWKNNGSAAIISHRLWQELFHGSPEAVGKSLTLDGSTATVVGVMPASFTFAADSIDAWFGMGWDPANRSQVFFRRAHWLRVIARLKEGVPPAVADAEFQAVVTALQREYPETNTRMGAEMIPLQEYLIGELRVPLLILQGAVGLLLLIACANVGNLLLAHAIGREREVSLRQALGARPERLLRQTLAESVLLAVLGGTAGLWLGWWGTKALAQLQPARMLPVAQVPMDLTVFATVSGITLLMGILFGLAPALWAMQRPPAEVLKESGRTGSAAASSRGWSDRLVTAEIALALLLTVGAGLLVRSFLRLQQEDPGLDPRGVLAFGVRLPDSYDSSDRQLQFFTALREKVAALPGTDQVAQGLVAPFGGSSFTSDFHLSTQAPEEYGSEVSREYVTPSYFKTLRIPLLAGRDFTAADQRGSEPVVIINEALARQYFKDQDPIGQRMIFDKAPDSTSVYRTIVGVVGSVRQRGLALAPQVAAYEPFGQQVNSYMTLLLRSTGDPGPMIPLVQQAIQELDPSIAFAETHYLTDLVARSIARQRYLMVLMLVFAGSGLLLSIVGIYGVMSQAASRRTREMGIRLALGATAREVQWLVVRHGVRLLAVGLAVGLAAALATTRWMSSLLYGVAPLDAVTFVLVPLLIAATAIISAWLPASRASRANPAVTLRED